MAVLATDVYLSGVRYPKGTVHTDLPAGVSDEIRNPGAWESGTVPALLGGTAGDESRITLTSLATRGAAREALGLSRVASSTKTSSYTLALVDAGTAVEFTGASAATLTVPLYATVAFPVGTALEVVQYGTGQVTIAGAGGVTLRTPASLTTRARYSSVALRCRALNEWIVSGDLT